MDPIDGPSALDQLMELASAKITRYEPAAALAAKESGAQLIDIRSHTDRQRDGVLPGSIHIPRTLFEWRASPDFELRNPHLDLRRPAIVVCNHGFSSVLAAATLADLGYEHPGDLIGGFEAWKGSGLPTVTAPANELEPHGLEGMSPPGP